MSRLLRFVLLAALVVVFVAITALLARALTVDGAERTAIEGLLRAEAAGDPRAMASRISGCPGSPACRTRVSQDAGELKHPGKLAILELNPSAGFSLSSTLGTARVAWRAGGSLPIVQCVRVRRAGNVLSGLHIELLKVSRRIASNSDCPATY